jgi:CubicO group peptidase (beta-lactamase class C family)
MLRQVALAVLFATQAPVVSAKAEVVWPGDEWATKGPEADAKKLDALLAVTDSDALPLEETRGVVIVHHGVIVGERYRKGFDEKTPQLSWSMAKSVTQAMLGIAVKRGLVDIDKPMGSPHWAAGDERAAIPWRTWMQMADGQEYHEIGVVDPWENDAARMLFGEGRRDVAGFAATLPLTHRPGEHWNYNSAGINLIADALGRAFAPGASASVRREKMLAVMKEELFEPIGMRSAQPEFDSTGTFIGSAFVYATPRDWARFGLLYLRGGEWNGKRILPEGWTDFAHTKTIAPDSDIYGAGFWITPQSGRGKPFGALCPNGPKDLYVAEGHQGQVVAIIPSKDLVVVRLGFFHDDESGFPTLGDWLEKVVALFPDR